MKNNMIKKFVRKVYDLIAKIYIFVFGRKVMQKINSAIFLLTLKAKGYTNYGNHKYSGEHNFIKLIRQELEICIDVGANVGSYTKEILETTDAKVIAIEPLEGAFKKLSNLKDEFKDRLEILNHGAGDENEEKKYIFSNESSELASFYPNTNEFSFVDNKNTKYHVVKIKKKLTIYQN